jgi:hypothetical protein
MVEPTCEQFERWRQNSMKVDSVRLDNAGANNSLQKPWDSVDWKFGIAFEYRVGVRHNRTVWLRWD